MFDSAEEERLAIFLQKSLAAESKGTARSEELGRLSRTQLLELFGKRVQHHLRVVLCMSPAGEALRVAVRHVV